MMNDLKQYVQVNIGRNVGEEPLSPALWDAFIHDTMGDLASSSRSGVPAISVHYGQGTWLNDAGQTVVEESAHVSAICDIDAYALRIKLARLAYRYHQEAIALIVGSDLIVGA